MFALAPFCVLPFATTEFITPPVPVVIMDMHDGGKNKRKEPRYDEDSKRRDARRKEVIAVYEELVEGRPRIVAQIVAPFVGEQTKFDIPPVNAIDFDALLADVARVEALYREIQEMDDEEVLLLL